MLGITPFGMFHTILSLIAVAAGIVALVRHAEIAFRDSTGKVYVYFTIATCVTGLFIFQHGGFGKPHVLAIVTLVVLALAYAAERKGWFGRASRYVSTIGFSLTLFFHMIPAFTETGTRLPLGAPVFASREAPELQVTVACAFAVFLIGAMIQALRIHSRKVLPATT